MEREFEIKIIVIYGEMWMKKVLMYGIIVIIIIILIVVGINLQAMWKLTSQTKDIACFFVLIYKIFKIGIKHIVKILWKLYAFLVIQEETMIERRK